MNKEISVAQLAANRTNAQFSTGPNTEAGKAASSRNSRSHGLSGKNFVVLAWETQEDYDQLLADLHAEYKPSSPTERLLVDSLAQHRWLSDRATTLQELCFDGTRPGECADQLLSVYLRYQTHHERAFHKCLNQLIAIRRERQKEHDGFVSQTMRIANGHRNDDRHFLQLELLQIKRDKAKRSLQTTEPPVSLADSAPLATHPDQQPKSESRLASVGKS